MDEVLQGQDGFGLERRPSWLSAPCSGGLDAVFGALRDEASLEVRDGPEHMEYEFASGGGCVNPLLKADQVDLSGFEVVDGFEQFLEGAPQTIEPNNGEGIIWTGKIE